MSATVARHSSQHEWASRAKQAPWPAGPPFKWQTERGSVARCEKRRGRQACSCWAGTLAGSPPGMGRCGHPQTPWQVPKARQL